MEKRKRKQYFAVKLAAFLTAAGLAAAGTGLFAMRAEASADDDAIKQGIYVENIDLSGLKPTEAKAKIRDYVDKMKETPVMLEATDGESIALTVGDLGLSWANEDIIEDAVQIGREGNIIERYKALRDLAHESMVYPLELAADKAAIKALIEEQGAKYNIEAENATLRRENGQFFIEGGQTGVKVNADVSAERVYEYLLTEWDRASEISLGLEIEIEQPKGAPEDLAKVKDVLGTYTTSYRTSGVARSENVSNGCALINGVTLYPGEEFSTYHAVSPFTEANGYYPAGSYLNGMVVDSLGGGICQVSTTLYNAVLLAELDVTERHNHSMIVTYVNPSADAAIAESSGKDFRFVNNTEYPIYIEGKTADKHVTFTIYGAEYRNSDRTVIYESETLSKKEPENERIIATANRPVGYVDVQSAHIGYTARLWKVVVENGVEVSRTQVNKSSYAMSPRTATVGIATADPNVLAAMQAAIATGSIDYVRAVASSFTAPAAAPAAPPEEGQPQEAVPEI